MSYNLNQIVNLLSSTPSDINQHLQFLATLSTECESVLECGVRNIVSTWAFIKGLVNNTSTVKQLMSCDLDRPTNLNKVEEACKENGIDFSFFQGNDLKLPMKQFDLIFIDTWHVYGHLKRELELMNPYAKKYIVLHDTEVDKVDGESIRQHMNVAQQSKDSGIPEGEIRRGLGLALLEFLLAHPEWKVKIHFTHNHGLTVLERF